MDKKFRVVYNEDSIIKKTTWYKNGQKKEEGSYNWNEKKMDCGQHGLRTDKSH